MKTAKFLTGLWAVICLCMMVYLSSKSKTEWAICWGIYSIWSLVIFFSYENKTKQ
jgi:hypothetical protein